MISLHAPPGQQQGEVTFHSRNALEARSSFAAPSDQSLSIGQCWFLQLNEGDQHAFLFS
jgi:hypothetical protein